VTAESVAPVDIKELIVPEAGVGFYEFQTRFKGEEAERELIAQGPDFDEGQTEMKTGVCMSKRNYEKLSAKQQSIGEQNLRKMQESVMHSMFQKSDMSQGTVNTLDAKEAIEKMPKHAQSMM
jgi:hypothetical protein